MTTPAHVAIVGRGVIGATYGWALQGSGHRVTFISRTGSSALLGPVDINVIDSRTSALRGVESCATLDCDVVEGMPADHDYDLVIVTVQHYHLRKALGDVVPNLGTAILLIAGNVWEEPAGLRELLPHEQTVWGFPGAGGGFDAEGVLRSALFSQFTLGTFRDETPTPAYDRVQTLLEGAGFVIDPQQDFRSWLFAHFTLNAATSLQRVSGVGAAASMRSPWFWREARANGSELFALLEARDVHVPGNRDLQLLGAPACVPWMIMNLGRLASPPLRRVLSDHTNLQEARSYCIDVLEVAEQHGVALPRFEASRSAFIDTPEV